MNEEIKEQEILLNKIVQLRKSLEERIDKLRSDPNVKKYISLTKDLISTDKEYEEVKYQYLLATFKSCDHLFTVSESENVL